MHKKPTPIYLFVVLISLFIFGISTSIVLISVVSIYKYIAIFGIIIFAVVYFFIGTANKLNTDGFETKIRYKKECPKCKATINIRNKYCPKCGANTEETLECDYCSHQNPFDSANCEKCGADLR